MPLNFRAYYRVEVPQAPMQQAPMQQAPAEEAPTQQAPAEEVATEPAAVGAPESIALEPAGELLTLVPVSSGPPSEPEVSDEPHEGQPVGDQVAEAATAQPESAPALALVENVPVQAASPESAVAASNGRSRDAGNSLGFFA